MVSSAGPWFLALVLVLGWVGLGLRRLLHLHCIVPPSGVSFAQRWGRWSHAAGSWPVLVCDAGFSLNLAPNPRMWYWGDGTAIAFMRSFGDHDIWIGAGTF
uniref:Putative secreted protein n=1 Tax=Anopheles darlingi TaxID=43151 RepID=A0A2M4D1L7_ANODA